MIVKSLGNDAHGKRARKTPRKKIEFYGCMQNKAALSCVCVLPAVFCALKRQAVSLTLGKEKKRPKSN
jgi:hypothetical protein